MMFVSIHDVGHGACASIEFPNGRLLMFDCGAASEKGFSPGQWYKNRTIDLLTVQNLDQDHVSGIKALGEMSRVDRFFSNPSVGLHQFDRLKTDGLTEALAIVRSVLGKLGPVVGKLDFDTGGASVKLRYLPYMDSGLFDTNDLSVVAIVEYAGFKIVLGGDLEKFGWQCLMLDATFRAEIANANLFVASHHGRENGRCEEVMRLMQPDAVIFSDGRKRYETQETDAWYRQCTRGILDLNRTNDLRDPKYRYVLTTRRDGSIGIAVSPSSGYRVFVEKPSEPKDEHTLLIDTLTAFAK